jgi:hypothetical protein
MISDSSIATHVTLDRRAPETKPPEMETRNHTEVISAMVAPPPERETTIFTALGNVYRLL